MLEIIMTKLMPIILYFFIGYILKIFDILKKEEASVLLKLIFYLMSPAVIITSVSTMKFSKIFDILSHFSYMYSYNNVFYRKNNFQESKVK